MVLSNATVRNITGSINIFTKSKIVGENFDISPGRKLLPGSVVYQADMYATDADQSELLYDKFQLFVMEAGEINVGGKEYPVEIPQATEETPSKGRSENNFHNVVLLNTKYTQEIMLFRKS